MVRYNTLELIAQAEALPVRRDMVTLLTYVRDNKVVGTQATGNMPLKHIRALTARFVVPPVLDTTIGKHTYKLRTEYDVWPLYLLHVLAVVSVLLETPQGRRWRLTPDVDFFLNYSPLIQCAHLLLVWWRGVDWLVAYPRTGLGDRLPARFKESTLSVLSRMRVGESVAFDALADELIAKGRLKWIAPESEYARQGLHFALQRMVADVLGDFGVLELELTQWRVAEGLPHRIESLHVTPLGEALLAALHAQGG
jgi:hypothetical protein